MTAPALRYAIPSSQTLKQSFLRTRTVCGGHGRDFIQETQQPGSLGSRREEILFESSFLRKHCFLLPRPNYRLTCGLSSLLPRELARDRVLEVGWCHILRWT